MSFVNSLLTVLTSFAQQIVSGFVYQPAIKLKIGSVFVDMQIPIPYVDQNGNYFVGVSYGSTSIVSKPSFQQVPQYKPGDTQPPRAYPTYQPNGYQVPMGVNNASEYKFSAEGIRHLKVFEGLAQRPFTVNGQKYIGYGHRLAENDNKAYITREEADSLLQGDISTAEGIVKGAVNVKITQGVFDALVDFAYTVSPQNFKGSTVVQKINSGDIPGAATALAQWVYTKQNGIIAKEPHLVSRRTANIQWLTMPVNPLPPT